MRLVLHALIAYTFLVQLTWFLLQLSLVCFSNTTGKLPFAISASFFEFAWRCAATAGICLLVLWADRHPLYKGASFGSFVGTTLITFSWLALDLGFVYSAFATQSGSVLENLSPDWTGATNNGVWMVTFGSAVMSCLHFAGCFLLWCYALYQQVRATSVVKLSGLEKATHVLVWLGVAFYLIWTCAAIDVTTTNTLTNAGDSILGFYNSFALNGLVVFAFTSAAVVSLGADQAWRTACWFLNAMLFYALFPASVWVARGQWTASLGSSCGSIASGQSCAPQEAVAAGMVGVAAIALFIQLVTTPLVFMRTAPEYAAGVKTSSNDVQEHTEYVQQPAYTTAAPAPAGAHSVTATDATYNV